MKQVLVLGAGGFIGFHLCEKLCENPENYVIGVDKNIENIPNKVPLHIKIDLTRDDQCDYLFNHYKFDDVYQVAADSGNLEYLTSTSYNYGNSTLINLNIIRNLKVGKVNRFIFTSSDYARDFELTDYGLEKKYNEQLYRRSSLPIKIATLSNVYGIWDTGGSNEKLINALCRKVAEAKYGASIPVHNDGRLRSFVYIDDVVNMLIDMDNDLDIKSHFSISTSYLCSIINIVTKKSIHFDIDNYYPVGIKDNKEFIYTKNLEDGIEELYQYYLERIY